FDPLNCGVCGNDCNAIDPNAIWQCVGDACQASGCRSGYANCDNDVDLDEDDPDFGCEVATSSDVGNCGSCGNDCFATLATANPVCSGGSCGIASCTEGFADCNERTSDGCEKDLVSSSCGSATSVGEAMADSQCGVICDVDTINTN